MAENGKNAPVVSKSNQLITNVKGIRVETMIQESVHRMAWTQYEQGWKGSGLNAYKHRQPEPRREMELDYFIKSKGKV